MRSPVFIAPGEQGHPHGLRSLEEPPGLWVAGTIPVAPSVAVVGTRRCTRYGLRLAEQFGAVISESGWVTVSGLARGIDTAAHRGAVGGAGRGVAVLGSGIDVCYPSENEGLYHQLVEQHGAVVSEYGPGVPPDRWRFPARNRIIAALADATVVVESAVTGGALITARLAAEIGRPVFAVPGDVDRPSSEGCNRLIRDGANPVLGPSDLIEELSLVLGAPASRSGSRSSIPREGVSVSRLAEVWGLPPEEAARRLGRLELEGRVRRSGDLVFPAD